MMVRQPTGQQTANVAIIDSMGTNLSLLKAFYPVGGNVRLDLNRKWMDTYIGGTELGLSWQTALYYICHYGLKWYSAARDIIFVDGSNRWAQTTAVRGTCDPRSTKGDPAPRKLPRWSQESA
jgi:hypothetical protein